ncbi:MAG TPA: hypothetical protein VES65_11360 [Solirubrobacteraceae bacterium]|nr:hypothetical protein [Solirubrobacteraceae bacterium]
MSDENVTGYGFVDALDWRARADMHKPTDRAVLAREVNELARRGLTERDIGAHLGLDPSAVRQFLEAA